MDYQETLKQIQEWSKDVFLYTKEGMGMRPSEPIDELRGKPIVYTDNSGVKREVLLFDEDGRLVYHDLSFYTIDMFKHQDKAGFKKYYKGKHWTWQQTIEFTAYNNAINTFDKEAFEIALRWITIKSGHGIGKTSAMSVIASHFLICFFGSQIGVTANTADQLKDIFLKEFSIWIKRLPEPIQQNIEVLDKMVRIVGEKDWFLRTRVSSPDNPEALAGLHADYVLIIVDEASGIHNQVFEVMKGALTGENYIVIYVSNPTRNTGEFFESHKAGARYTQLSFSSRQSPIVKDGYIEKMEDDYGKDSDEVKIRVDGEFAGVTEMDDKGWIPLFANINIQFEPSQFQRITHGVMGVDPAGKGRDNSIAVVRDSVYMKEVLNENTSSELDLARKVETIRDAYGIKTNDVGVEAFGIGAKVVVAIRPNQDETDASPNAILMDKPREETKDRFNSYKSELGWKFREWVRMGGIIITNNQKAWLNEMSKIKYRRDNSGRIQLMGKIEFKKEYGFSPDRFDAGLTSFFKDEGTRPVQLTKNELEQKENMEWLEKIRAYAESQEHDDSYSSI